MNNAAAIFVTGKVYADSRGYFYRIRKITQGCRYSRRLRTMVANDWMMLEAGYLRDGKFHAYGRPYSKPIRRKIVDMPNNDDPTEYVAINRATCTDLKAANHIEPGDVR